MQHFKLQPLRWTYEAFSHNAFAYRVVSAIIFAKKLPEREKELRSPDDSIDHLRKYNNLLSDGTCILSSRSIPGRGDLKRYFGLIEKQLAPHFSETCLFCSIAKKIQWNQREIKI